ncbi:hypothetical protein SASPL_103232 [Salvia splendens]|uniref:Hcy-binding domain-containing protein n=1 Tax=Salvia splendens TaxID=180675 RepID=A0A8X8YVA0_SALSN|nr:hypothetical protein SASPL_103232 [Salvia splendens]
MGHAAMMSDFLRQCGGVAVIDGGFATELERHGADLNDPLWSAKCLLTSPDLIRRMIKSSHVDFGFFRLAANHKTLDLDEGVHLDYLEAGADIILTASYQATIQGFKNKGYSVEQGENMLRKSVELAREARDIYYTRCHEAQTKDTTGDKILKQRQILVAASVGSYGAYLADGSEYSGDYGDAMNLEFLRDFHRRRVKVLAEAGPDLIAFETVPNRLEAQAFAMLLEEENINVPAWLSFNSKDGINVVSGDSITECVAAAESSNKVVAVGINCTPPRFIRDLVLSIKKVTSKPILIYPNSGESYDADIKQWVQHTGVSDKDFVSYVNKWCEAGASLVGGCCRTTPHTIRSIYGTLSCKSSDPSLVFEAPRPRPNEG